MVRFHIQRWWSSHPSHSLLCLSFHHHHHHHFSSVLQSISFCHQLSKTVCVLLGYRQRESTDINTGDVPCWVCHYEAIAQSAPLVFRSWSRAMDDSSQTHTCTATHKWGTWIGGMVMAAHVASTFKSHMCVFCVATLRVFFVLRPLCATQKPTIMPSSFLTICSLFSRCLKRWVRASPLSAAPWP